jgi:hypothetical protein
MGDTTNEQPDEALRKAGKLQSNYVLFGSQDSRATDAEAKQSAIERGQGSGKEHYLFGVKGTPQFNGKACL